MATASILTQTVHQRTRKGQMVAAAQPPMLDEAHTMLLRLFNGFTPTPQCSWRSLMSSHKSLSAPA